MVAMLRKSFQVALLLFSYASVASFVGAAFDPCKDLALNAPQNSKIIFTIPSAARKCLLSMPFVPERDLPVLNNVISGLNSFYIYRDIAKSSPDARLPSTINIVRRLDEVREKAQNGTYTSVFKFYSTIAWTINLLNDGHTGFKNCLAPTKYLTLPVVGVVEDGKYVIRVRPYHADEAIPDFANQVLGIDLARYAGKVVETIEGESAFAYVLRYADLNAGQARDVGTRLNVALARPTVEPVDADYGLFGLADGLPAKNGLTYTIRMKESRDPETVFVPYLVLLSNNFMSSATYFTANCAAQKDKAAAKVAPRNDDFDDDEEPVAMLPKSMTERRFGDLLQRRAKLGSSGDDIGMVAKPGRTSDAVDMRAGPWRSRSSARSPVGMRAQDASSGEIGRSAHVTGMAQVSGGLTNVNPDGLYPVYVLPDGTAVVVYHTFKDKSKASRDYPAMVAETDTAFALANKHGQRVLLDMTSNGGGYTALAWYFIRSIVGSKNLPAGKHDPMRFRSNRMAGVYNNWYQHSFQNYLDSSSLQPLPHITPEVSLKYARGPKTPYSVDFISARDTQAMENVTTEEPVFGTRPVLVLTNGFCFSSCAIVTHVLKRHFGLKVVTVGGLLNQSVAISSSCLGFTQPSFNKILTGMQSLGIKGFPPPFSVDVDLAFGAASLYVKSAVPCEFVFLGGDHRVQYSREGRSRIDKVWEEAAKFFPTRGMPLKVD